MNINSEENMKETFRAIYKPVSASPEFKEALLISLIDKVSGEARGPAILLGVHPEYYMALATVIVLAVISYGLRLSAEVAAMTSLPVIP